MVNPSIEGYETIVWVKAWVIVTKVEQFGQAPKSNEQLGHMLDIQNGVSRQQVCLKRSTKHELLLVKIICTSEYECSIS